MIRTPHCGVLIASKMEYIEAMDENLIPFARKSCHLTYNKILTLLNVYIEEGS